MTIDPKLIEAIDRPIIIASHQRSGTHLTIDLIRRHFPLTNPRLRPLETLHHLYVDLDSFNPGHHNPMTVETALRLLIRVPRPIIKTHTLPSELLCKPEFRDIVHRIYERAQTVNVVRDGRNVMLSLHRFEKPWNPAARVPFPDFIRTLYEGLVRPAYWNHHVSQWQRVHDCLTLRFKDIIKSPLDAIHQLGAFLGMTPVLRDPILPPNMRNRYEGWLRRLVGNTETTTIPGERPAPDEPRTWKEAFTPEDCAFFRDHAGDRLIELNYESDHAWANSS